MRDRDNIEAEARALATKRAREREVARRADEIERDVQKQELIAATKARKAARAARPLWMKIGTALLVLAVIGGAGFVAVMGAKMQPANEQSQSDDCGLLASQAIEIAAESARTVCKCEDAFRARFSATDGAACVKRAMDATNSALAAVTRRRLALGTCPEGLAPYQQAAMEEHLARGQECARQWGAR